MNLNKKQLLSVYLLKN